MMKSTNRTTAGGMRGVCVAALAALLCAGCEEKKSPKPGTPTPPAPDVTPKAGGAAVSKSVGGAGGIATTGPSTTQTPDPKAAPTTKPTAAPAVAPLPPTVDAGQSREAQDLIATAMQAIKDNRLDEAAAALDKVEEMKEKLPKATQEQLKTVRGNLESVRKLQQTETPTATDAGNK